MINIALLKIGGLSKYGMRKKIILTVGGGSVGKAVRMLCEATRENQRFRKNKIYTF